MWVNSWLSTFSRPVALQGEAPLVLARGLWAGGQRFGVVLWSSDIQSSFEQLATMVPQGVHASLSGVPWWTTDVGAFFAQPVKPARTQSRAPQARALSRKPPKRRTTNLQTGGYGCRFSMPNESPYMKELIVRWYVFAAPLHTKAPQRP